MPKNRIRGPALALMLAPALGACSNGSAMTGDGKDMADPAPPTDMTTSSSDMATAPPFCAGGTLTKAQDNQFMGSWAIQSKVTQSQDVPGFGTKESTTTTLSFADFKLDGQNQLVMTQKDCKITSTGVPGVSSVTIPDAVPQTTPTSTAAIKVCDTGGTVSWQRDQATVLVGCKLADPNTTPLPTLPSDPAVFDQDNDGKSGVTIKITGIVSGDVYTVQRQRFSYTSSALPTAGKANGSTIDRSEQNTVDASNTLLKQKVPLNPVDAKSTFRLAKITGITTCTELIAQAGTLFP
ncbi:MAG: hypothetical protein JNJ46_11840 [Myxococcales bacterium]|nr:hypothetical protein [Myxococcales bacterium]